MFHLSEHTANLEKQLWYNSALNTVFLTNESTGYMILKLLFNFGRVIDIISPTKPKACTEHPCLLLFLPKTASHRADPQIAPLDVLLYIKWVHGWNGETGCKMHKMRKAQRRFFPEEAVLQNRRRKLLVRSYEKMTSVRHLHLPTIDG